MWIAFVGKPWDLLGQRQLHAPRRTLGEKGGWAGLTPALTSGPSAQPTRRRDVSAAQATISKGLHLPIKQVSVGMFSRRLVEPTPTEGALLYYGQTIAFGFDKKGQPVQIQNGGLAGWRFRDFVGVVSW